MDKPHIYEIRIAGHLTERWSSWFDGLAIYHEASGETLLKGSFIDQPALFGTLNKIHSLNLTLIAVNRQNRQAER